MQSSLRSSRANAYQSVAAWTSVSDTDPHRLILMLFDGALARVAAARGCMQNGLTAEKGQFISRALAIVEELRGSLDLVRGGSLAANLDDLYEYIERRLVAANAGNNGEALDEVTSLLRELRDGWSAINGNTPRPA